MKTRKQIPEKYKWDLTPLCKNDEVFGKTLEKAKAYLPKLKKFEGKLKDKQTILQYLKLDKEFSNLINPIAQYLHLKQDEELSNPKYQLMGEKLSYFLNEVSIETSFASTELYELSNEALDEIIADPDFANYDRMFKDIKKDKKHKLSKAEEKLLAGMDFLGGFAQNMRNLSDVDFNFGEIEDEKGRKLPFSHSLYGKYMRSKDRTLRKNAFACMNGKFGQSINMLANNYINDVKANCYFAKVRKYKSVLESELEGEEVTPKVYKTLIEMVHQNLPLLFDYFKIKQKELGLKEMYIYDTMTATDKNTDKTYTYDEAIEIIKQALAPLGEEYVGLIQRAKEERWIDVMPNKDKRSGAYESGIYGYNPYVLTNFEGDIDSIFTLAHELGHAMHSYFSNKNQPEEKVYYTIFLAEIASTTNEILLINYFLQRAKTSEEKCALYNKLFDEVKGSIFRQTMFAEFEEKMHAKVEAGEGLNKDILCNEYYALNKQYFGFVKLTEETKYEWARIPHFFTCFYVYKYATGMICAINFANRILNKEKGALADYFKFLSAGNSASPIAILRKSHCDLEKQETFDKAFDYLKQILGDWKKLN
ncbi:MAG: oligoendopeptidase F [Clostridia bacterium]|nr:oligoendopeptidase F [Clostridia bacterium]